MIHYQKLNEKKPIELVVCSFCRVISNQIHISEFKSSNKINGASGRKVIKFIYLVLKIEHCICFVRLMKKICSLHILKYILKSMPTYLTWIKDLLFELLKKHLNEKSLVKEYIKLTLYQFAYDTNVAYDKTLFQN